MSNNPSPCPHLHTSYYGGFHAAEGDVWDDITEVCDDCGAVLSSPEQDDLFESDELLF